MNPSTAIKIVMADDQEFFMAGFSKFLNDECPEEIEIIATASNGIELVELVSSCNPHIVITDINMPGMNGIDACKIIKQKFPSINIIAFSVFYDNKYILAMIEAGAKGYLAKHSTKREMIEAIRAVSLGQNYYCSTVSGKIYGTLLSGKKAHRNNKKIVFSAQETIVMKLVCKQLSNKEIAGNMHLAVRTVEKYKYHIQEKIGARNTVGIAMYALAHELVMLSDLF